MKHHQQHTAGVLRSTVSSPRTNPTGKHVVTRQLFALPVLQQFEPVLASSPRSYMVPTGSIPKIDTGTSRSARGGDSRPPSSGSVQIQADNRLNASDNEVEVEMARPESLAAAVLAASPGTLPQRPRDRANSPRALRPQPPPVGISARADVDIYRYSQGTAQRMAIRPLFEQRREDEALVARQIIAMRDRERRVDEKGEQQHQLVEETSARHIDDRGVEEEFATIKFLSPRSATTHRRRPRSGDPVELLGEARVATPEPFEVALPSQTVTDSAFCATGSTDSSSDGRFSQRAYREAEVVAPTGSQYFVVHSPSLTRELSLVPPLLPGRYYEPFLPVDSDILSMRIKEIIPPESVAPVQSTKRTQSVLQDEERARPIPVLYRVLWKELRVFQACGEVALTALLSSEADAHIAVACASSRLSTHELADKEDARIQITEAHLVLSRRLRPDLRVLTPPWAKWVLSRVQWDAAGAFFLQLERDDSPCCYAEDLVEVPRRPPVRVEMRALTGTSLLVTAIDATSGDTSTVFLGASEIVQLATSFGKSPRVDDAPTSQDASVEELLQSPSFLSQVATKSTVIRLAMRATDPLESFVRTELRVQSDTPPLTPGTEDVPTGARSTPDVFQLLRPNAFSRDVFALLLDNSALATVAFLSQAYVENGMVAALRHLQRADALAMHIQSYMTHEIATASGESFSDLITAKIEAAQLAKLTEVAVGAIVDDMVTELIAYEGRLALDDAKYSGGYNDHYASKVQSAFRMSTQRKHYTQQQHTRARAARLLQALQRGVAARKRFVQMRIEREKYLFDGFRSSLHASVVVGMADPKTRCREVAEDTERRRHTFLMHVLEGHVAESGASLPYRVSTELVATLFSEYGVVVGCPTTFGDIVASFLRDDSDSDSGSDAPARKAEDLHTSGHVSAALLLALRSQYDDTFGLSAATRQSLVGNQSSSSASMQNADAVEAPPRWLLKLSTPFQRANRARLAALRLTKTAAGQKASHLVARDFRTRLQSAPLASFESCRAVWEASIRSRRAERQIYDASSTELVAQYVLDNVVASIKDWGMDPEPLFNGLNVCVRHRHGINVAALVETQFNAFAADVNALHGKRCVLSLRDEIAQELEDFEQLLALRCLNLGAATATVPPSELLQIVLHGSVNVEFVRHALPTLLPVARVGDKYALAQKLVRAYAGASYGDAFNAICWSCLDAAENVTVEAAQLLCRLTRDDDASSVASRALYVLVDGSAVTFLQFVAKVAHFNETTRSRVVALLRPYAAQFELHRFASALASVDDFSVVARVYADAFAASATYENAPLWATYEKLFGRVVAERARATGQCSAAATDGR